MNQRALFVLAIIPALLAGCGNVMQGAPTISTIEQEPAPDSHCSAVARQRAEDALANGYGFGIEDTVYRESYADCISWRERHSP